MPVAVQVINQEGCRSQEQVIVVPEPPATPSCGLVGAELLILLRLKRPRARRPVSSEAQGASRPRPAA